MHCVVSATNCCCIACWFTASCVMAAVTATVDSAAVVAVKLLCVVNAAICVTNDWTLLLSLSDSWRTANAFWL